MNKMRKAQLQLMENVFVMIIIFIILIIAFLFVVVIQKDEQKDKFVELKELEMIKKAQILNFLPEMQCSDNNNLDPDCYDILKIQTFRDYLEEDETYYRYLLGNVKIEIFRYDPSPGINTEVERWIIYDNPPEIDNGVQPVRFPVLLKDVTQNSNYFGVIILGVYE